MDKKSFSSDFEFSNLTFSSSSTYQKSPYLLPLEFSKAARGGLERGEQPGKERKWCDNASSSSTERGGVLPPPLFPRGKRSQRRDSLATSDPFLFLLRNKDTKKRGRKSKADPLLTDRKGRRTTTISPSSFLAIIPPVPFANCFPPP